MFFEMLEEAGLWNAWNGLPVSVAATARVDAVTSATYSSKAAIENVRAALASVPGARAGGSTASSGAPSAQKSTGWKRTPPTPASSRTGQRIRVAQKPAGPGLDRGPRAQAAPNEQSAGTDVLKSADHAERRVEKYNVERETHSNGVQEPTAWERHYRSLREPVAAEQTAHPTADRGGDKTFPHGSKARNGKRNGKRRRFHAISGKRIESDIAYRDSV